MPVALCVYFVQLAMHGFVVWINNTALSTPSVLKNMKGGAIVIIIATANDLIGNVPA